MDIIDAQMAFFGTGCIINEQVVLQDQEGEELMFEMYALLAAA